MTEAIIGVPARQRSCDDRPCAAAVGCIMLLPATRITSHPEGAQVGFPRLGNASRTWRGRVAAAVTVSVVTSVVSSLGAEAAAPTAPPAVGAVGMAPSLDGNGYWITASYGDVLNFGSAGALGSPSGLALNAPLVGVARTASGNGYWLLGSDGGVFTYGDAPFHGSEGGVALNQPVVGIAGTPSGNGYWLVASDGGIFTFGDAPYLGSEGGKQLNQPIVGMAATPSGHGYWMVARDGGIFTFGDAPFQGSGAGRIRYGDDVASRPECGVPSNAVGTSGKVIVISLACQLLSAYQDGMPVLTTFITTGRPALPTPPGQYSVLRKVSPWLMTSDWPTSSPYWYPPSWVQYTLWFRNDGYAIHDAPWPSTYGPGTEANGSHGCVNVPMPTMETLYAWATVGIPVRVY